VSTTAQHVEVIHGVEVTDPFRWLEDGESAETRAWVRAQNAATRRSLDNFPHRAAIHARLDGLLTAGSVSAPVVRGTRFFYERRDGRLDQPILVLREATSQQERPLVDPNALNAAGIVALDWW
jgi:prolyl oligopeptidase